MNKTKNTYAVIIAIVVFWVLVISNHLIKTDSAEFPRVTQGAAVLPNTNVNLELLESLPERISTNHR